MTLRLNVSGLVAADLDATTAFYRRLGLESGGVAGAMCRPGDRPGMPFGDTAAAGGSAPSTHSRRATASVFIATCIGERPVAPHPDHYTTQDFPEGRKLVQIGVRTTMLKGFKDFLMRGNVIDLSVAVVMGTAFTAIVRSVTKGIVEPLLAIFGSNSQLGLGFQLVPGKPATFIAIGPIISAAIDFLMVAAVLYFALILPMNTLKNRFARGKTQELVPTQEELLAEIRDLLAAQASGKSDDSKRSDDSEPIDGSAVDTRRVTAKSIAD